MGRPLRVDVGGYVYHVLNQATMFDDSTDYQQFEQVLEEPRVRIVMVHACAMPSFVEKIPLLC